MLTSFAKLVAFAGLAAAATSSLADIPLQAHAGNLTDVKIEQHFFSTRVRGTGGNVGPKDPSLGREMIFIVSADAPPEMSRLYAMDFVLVYHHPDGSPDRANCDAVAPVQSDGMVGTFLFGQYSHIPVSGGRIRFATCFYVEKDVDEVQLYRIGVNNSIVRPIGLDRPYSVYMTTNTPADTIDKARQAIEQAGFTVVLVSHGLNAEKTGITILYEEKAEAKAHEIGDLLSKAFGVTPKLQEIDSSFAAECDILVWFGK